MTEFVFTKQTWCKENEKLDNSEKREGVDRCIYREPKNIRMVWCICKDHTSKLKPYACCGFGYTNSVKIGKSNCQTYEKDRRKQNTFFHMPKDSFKPKPYAYFGFGFPNWVKFGKSNWSNIWRAEKKTKSSFSHSSMLWNKRKIWQRAEEK